MELWTGSLCAAVISRRVGVDLPNPPSHNEQMNEIEIFSFTEGVKVSLLYELLRHEWNH